MNEKEKIKELAIATNEFLSVYIQIHNKINHEAESFISVLKNLFGQGVPMSKLLEFAKSLIPNCNSLKAQFEYFELTSYTTLSEDEKRYFDILYSYLNSLESTINCLIDKQKLLEIKSKGLTNKTITLKDITLKGKEYNSLIEEYLTIGRQLNNMSYIIFS